MRPLSSAPRLLAFLPLFLLIGLSSVSVASEAPVNAHNEVQRRQESDSSAFTIELVENTAFNPSALDLLSDAYLKFGVFKHSARRYPELNSTLTGLLQSLPLAGGSIDIDKRHRGVDAGRKTRRHHKRRHSRQTKRNPDPLLGLSSLLNPLTQALGLGGGGSGGGGGGGGGGINLGLDLGIINLGVGVNLNLFGRKVLVDGGWGNSKVTRLSNSKSDNAWFGKIDFGTPPQSLVMLIDSGSADTVVFDDQCQTCQLNNHTAFNEEASSTFVNTGATFSTQYGDGTTLSGILGKDTVALSKRLAVSSQLIALISSRQGGSSAHAWDGILGIGPDQLSYVDGNVTPLSNAIKNSQLRAPLVGIVLRKASSLPWGGSDGLYNSGEYRWGAINAAYLASPIIYTPVTSTYYWGVDMAQIWVNGQAMTNANSARRALIDTGTTLVYTSDYSAAAIHAQIPGSTLNAQQGAYYVPCSPAYNAPNVFFEVAGHRWGVPPADIAFRPSGLNDGMCVSGIQGGAEDFTILGDVFIKNHYLVLNYGDANSYSLKVGLANRTDIPVML